jgi:uncharacterized protein YPO0396
MEAKANEDGGKGECNWRQMHFRSKQHQIARMYLQLRKRKHTLLIVDWLQNTGCERNTQQKHVDEGCKMLLHRETGKEGKQENTTPESICSKNLEEERLNAGG